MDPIDALGPGGRGGPGRRVGSRWTRWTRWTRSTRWDPVDAVEAFWPRTIVRKCVIRLLRGSFRYAARQDWDKIVRALTPALHRPHRRGRETPSTSKISR